MQHNNTTVFQQFSSVAHLLFKKRAGLAFVRASLLCVFACADERW